jgi:hypothetical protein
MKPTVYIETTIPSYYYDGRPELTPDIARTRQWWDHERVDYECFISQIVWAELTEGEYPNKEDCLALIADVSVLSITDEIERIAAVYRAQSLMPRLPSRDSLHVAIASFYRMDFLLTWNCRHLANANKVKRLRELNLEMGLSIPQLITPDQLQPLEDDL